MLLISAVFAFIVKLHHADDLATPELFALDLPHLLFSYPADGLLRFHWDLPGLHIGISSQSSCQNANSVADINPRGAKVGT